MQMAKITAEPLGQPRVAWLNRNVLGMGLTSLLSDAGHEMATVALPGFLAVLGVSAAALGAIEGIADATSSFVKLGAGWFSDRLGHRKPITVGGYLLTGIAKALFALAHGWPLILTGRVLAWFGRGIRGPLRDAMLADSVPQEARGKAFGFHRAGDTLGAIIGPLLAVGLLAYLEPHAADLSGPFRIVFLLTLIPGLGSAVCFAALVRETRYPRSEGKFRAAIGNLPVPFRRFLWGVGTFGVGDYAHILLILAATQLLTPTYGVSRAAQIAGLLYVARNVFYAAASYPVGALSDRWGRRGLLALGYLVGALTTIGFVVAFLWEVSALSYLLLLFALGGTYIAIEDTLEGALTADLVAPEIRGTAYGVMGTVNGVGDLVASVMVGTLWTAISPAVAFACAAGLMLLGGAVVYRFR
jgi:MFS family permease